MTTTTKQAQLAEEDLKLTDLDHEEACAAVVCHVLARFGLYDLDVDTDLDVDDVITECFEQVDGDYRLKVTLAELCESELRHFHVGGAFEKTCSYVRDTHNQYADYWFMRCDRCGQQSNEHLIMNDRTLYCSHCGARIVRKEGYSEWQARRERGEVA